MRALKPTAKIFPGGGSFYQVTLRSCQRLALTFLLASGIYWINPLGLIDTSGDLNLVLLRTALDKSRNLDSSAVSILLITNKTLQAEGSHWPLDFQTWADTLRLLGHYHPKSIFLDIGFADERQEAGAAAFASALTELKSMSIPVYAVDIFADRQASGAPGEHIRRDLAPHLLPVAATLSKTDSNDSIEYPSHATGDSGLRTAAFAIWQDFYQPRLAMQSSPSLWRQWLGFGHQLGEPGGPSLFIDWWSQTPAANQWMYRDANKQPEGCEIITFGNIAWNGIKLPENPCPPIRTLHLEMLSSAAPKSTLKSLLEGKHVMIGTSLEGVPDLVKPPFRPPLPGVYYHAQALDNLIGNSSKALTLYSEGSRAHSIVTWSMLLLCCLLARMWQNILSRLHREITSRYADLARQLDAIPDKLRQVGENLFQAVSAVAIGGVISWHFSISPPNTLGMLGCALLAIPLTNFLIPKKISNGTLSDTTPEGPPP